MSYSVNPMLFRSIFAVPTDIVDKHIRLATEHQLKVLLWILRYSPENPDIDEMCTALKIKKSDAEDYLQYWVMTGVLSGDNGETLTAAETPKQEKRPVEKEKVDKQKKEVENVPSKPSSAEIAARIEESPEIGHLFAEAQVKLGKTIGYDGQCTLLLLHDHYGLPTEVIFMLIDYCVSVGKSNYSYISAVGKDWGLKEIDSLDKAAEQITALRNSNSLWKEFAAAAGFSNPRPTRIQLDYIRRWGEEFKFGIDIIILAYEIAVDKTGKPSLNYTNGILKSWFEKGYKTPEDVTAGEQQSSGKPAYSSAKQSSSSKASYDLDEFKERSLHSELKYERKKKK